MKNLVINEASSADGILSLLAVVVSVGALVFTVYWNFRAEKQGYTDSYWFRVVVGPKCVEPIVAFRDKWNVRVAELQSEMSLERYRSIVGELQVDRAALEDSLWISKIFGPTIFSECTAVLDSLEDSFANKLVKLIVMQGTVGRVSTDLSNDILTSSVKMLASIAKIHASGLKVKS